MIDDNGKFIAFSVTREAKRAMFISFTSLSLSFIGGTMIIIQYVTAIFDKTGSSMSDKDSSLLVSIVQLSTSIVVLNIVDRFNRRVPIYFPKFKFHACRLNDHFSISDPVPLVIVFNYSSISLVCYSLYILVNKSNSSLDVTIFLWCDYVLRLLGRRSDTIYYLH